MNQSINIFIFILFITLSSYGCVSNERAQVLDESRTGKQFDNYEEVNIHIGKNESNNNPVAIFTRGVSTGQTATDKIFYNIKRMASEIGCRNVYVIHDVMNGNRILWTCHFYE